MLDYIIPASLECFLLLYGKSTFSSNIHRIDCIYSGNTSSDKGHKGGLCNAATRLNHVEQKKNILLVAGRNNPREIQPHLVIQANVM